MKREQDTVVLAGWPVERSLYFPDGGVRATAILLHGHGDHISRYEAILPDLLAQGIAVIGADLPGHGHSPGRRGHVPGMSFVEQLIDSHLARLAELQLPEAVGIIGHSCGGLLALYTLLNRPHPWKFAWLSSPLIFPEASQPPCKATLFLFASRLMPWLSVNTGVRESDCSNAPLARDPSDPNTELFHTRITLSWAREIQETAAKVRADLRSSRLTLPVLVTQGGDDPVCPPAYARAYLASLAWPSLSYREFPGLRHEPFADEGRDAVLGALNDFLQEPLSALPRPDKPRGT